MKNYIYWLAFITSYSGCVICDHYTGKLDNAHAVPALLNYTYIDPEGVRHLQTDMARFGKNQVKPVHGMISHAWTIENRSDACSTLRRGVERAEPWIALVKRGACNFSTKIKNTMVLSNASAALIYDNEPDSHQLVIMEHIYSSEIALFTTYSVGKHLSLLSDNGLIVELFISPQESPHLTASNTLSVMMVSVSFIILMIISLAWLVFYYVQRFRYAHAKDRLQKRLANAARRAITKIEVKILKAGDEETTSSQDPCAICIEGYNITDEIRRLPCKHVFHKSCIDPWLLDHRTCPMCKLDIIKCFGPQLYNINKHGSAIAINAANDTEGVATGVEAVAAHPSSSISTVSAWVTPVLRSPSPNTTHETAAASSSTTNSVSNPATSDQQTEDMKSPLTEYQVNSGGSTDNQCESIVHIGKMSENDLL